MNAPSQLARALCVSIHDVAAPTWPQCLQLIAALRDVGRFPQGLLLAPCWHGHRLDEDPDFIAALQSLLDDGLSYEVLLHGLYRCDDARKPKSLSELMQRRLLTCSEVELAALDAAPALARIQAGLNDLQACGLQCLRVNRFVPPAWLMPRSARQALLAEGSRLGLRYLSLFSGLLDLNTGCLLRARALGYSARLRAGDLLLRGAVGAIARLKRGAPLIRLGLHPADAYRPQNLRHAQQLLEQVCCKTVRPSPRAIACYVTWENLSPAGRKRRRKLITDASPNLPPLMKKR